MYCVLQRSIDRLHTCQSLVNVCRVKMLQQNLMYNAAAHHNLGSDSVNLVEVALHACHMTRDLLREILQLHVLQFLAYVLANNSTKGKGKRVEIELA